MTTKASEENGTPFDPGAHLTSIKGKEYLEVKWRLVWFRSEHPLESGWGIRTMAEEVTPQGARYRAQVISPEGNVVAEGTKTETIKGFADYVEKAETGAIGRALAICGYGTQFCGDELDEGERIVDSPVSRPAPRPEPVVSRQPTPTVGDSRNAPVFANPGELFEALSELGYKTTEARNRLKAEVGLESSWPDMGASGWTMIYNAAQQRQEVAA